MKKITFIAALVSTIFGYSQTYDFSNSLEDWAATGGCALVVGATEMNVNLTESGSNPSFAITTATINATTNKIGAVTIKNSSATGPTYIRMSYPKAAGGRIYINLEMTAGDTEFQTYYFDLTNADWDGTESDVKIHFKASGNTTYTIPAGVTMLVDKIEFLAEIPTTERQTYNFDTDDDSEGWSAVNGAITSVSSGVLTFTPTADKFAKLQLDGGLYHVNASSATVMHITLQNLSTNDDELRVIVGGGGNTTQAISTSDGTEQSYAIDLSGITGWTGDLNSIQLGFRDADNASGTGKSSGTGAILINSIVFNNSLSVAKISKDDNTVQISPNPVVKSMIIESEKEIQKVEIFSVTGAKVFTNRTKQLDLSFLESGVYIAKIYFENATVSTRKFLKN